MTLAQAFAKGSGRKTKWQGRTVHSFVRIPVTDGDRILVHRLRSSRVRAQAIKMAVDRGELRANGVVVPTVAVWSHTAPETAELDVVGRRAKSLDIWNSWSFEGVDSSWLGNAGILVESSATGHLLRCSDGLGDPSFDDLVVRIEVQSVG